MNITRKNQVKFETQDKIYDECFMDLVKNLDIPPRPIDKPFRMTITNVY